MNSITECNQEELVDFFLSDAAYTNLSLPPYISFSKMLKNIYEILSDKKSPFFNKIIKAVDAKSININHSIICNKNNGFSWRKITLINPYFYVHCIVKLTSDDFWPSIREQLIKYENNEKIKPINLPFVKKGVKVSSAAQNIKNWWSNFENESLSLYLEYQYIAKADVANCYDSIYSHSLEWVFSSKFDAKNGNANSVGSGIDKLVQLMNEGQTNGILTGSELCNLFAELVLGDVDLKLRDELDSLKVYEYKILRYRDDYRIFCNNEVNCLLILKTLSEILQVYGMSLNSSKTEVNNDIIFSSIKKEKSYTINNPLPKGISIQKKIFFVYSISGELGHSKMTNKYLNEIFQEVKKYGVDYKYNSFEGICAILVALMINNSNAYQSAMALLSTVLGTVTKSQRSKILPLFFKKMNSLPNTYFFNIWFQRLILPYRDELELEEGSGYDLFKQEDKICNLINNHIFDNDIKVNIWDYSFIEKLGVSGAKLKKLMAILDERNIIVEDEIENLDVILSEHEFDIFSYE